MESDRFGGSPRIDLRRTADFVHTYVASSGLDVLPVGCVERWKASALYYP